MTARRTSVTVMLATILVASATRATAQPAPPRTVEQLVAELSVPGKTVPACFELYRHGEGASGEATHKVGR
jgi:hypothetical protein